MNWWHVFLIAAWVVILVELISIAKDRYKSNKR